MRIISIVATAIFVSGIVNVAYAAPKESGPKQCRKILQVEGNSAQFIYKTSAPMRAGNKPYPAPLIGFRDEPTLIMNQSSLPNRGGTVILDSKGNKIGSCPWATAHGHSGGRYRCTMSTGGLRKTAAKAGSSTIYFTLSGGRCARVPNAGQCYGSSKGKC